MLDAGGGNRTPMAELSASRSQIGSVCQFRHARTKERLYHGHVSEFSLGIQLAWPLCYRSAYGKAALRVGTWS